MAQRTRAQRLNGLFPLSYTGVVPTSPPNFIIDNRAPTINDSKNFYLGDLWLDDSVQPPDPRNVWMLVSLVGNNATWIHFGGGDLETLTGNSGGAVSPDGVGNINVLGDTTTINVAGNPATHTLTISTVGTGVISTLTGDTGGAVPPTAGNINVIAGHAALGSGSSVIINGTPGTSTLQLAVTDSSSNTIIGNNAGNLTLSGSNNTALGKTVLHALTTANANTVVGSLSGALITTGGNNTIYGEGSGTVLLTGTSNIMVGQGSGTAYTGSESNNITIGTSNVGRIAETGTLWIGNRGGSNLTANTFIGSASGNTAYTVASGIDNTAVGAGTLLSMTTATRNTVMGVSSGTALTTGASNTAIGCEAFEVATLANSCTAVGNTALRNYVGTGMANQDAHTACGDQTLFSLASGIGNTAIGSATLSQLFGGDHNTAVGWISLQGLGNAGTQTAFRNTAVGAKSGQSFLTGTDNTLIGYNAGSAYVGAESSNICIGSGVTGLAGESNKTKIANIRGVTTTNADAVAVLIDSAGQLGTISSSERYKDDIEDMDDYSSPIMDLRPVTFSWKNSNNKGVQRGLIAEEVDVTFPDLCIYNEEGKPETVRYHELPVLLLNELQKLKARVIELEDRLIDLEVRFSKVNVEISEL